MTTSVFVFLQCIGIATVIDVALIGGDYVDSTLLYVYYFECESLSRLFKYVKDEALQLKNTPKFIDDQWNLAKNKEFPKNI